MNLFKLYIKAKLSSHQNKKVEDEDEEIVI